MAPKSYHFLVNSDELMEILRAKNSQNLLFGCIVNKQQEKITFYRGNFENFSVSFSKFEISGDGTKPDFDNVSIIDYGNGVKLGNYEAATDCLLESLL